MFGYGEKFETSFSGSSASFLGVAIYGNKDQKWWFKTIVKPLWTFGRRIHNFKYWYRYRFVEKHKYHLIDTKLGYGYHDIDRIMLHGNFALLDRYVEQEMEGVDSLEKWGDDLVGNDKDHFMYESNKRQGEKELEAVYLYRWWHETRPAYKKRRDELMDKIYSDFSFTFEKIEGSECSRLVTPELSEDKFWLRAELKILEEKIDSEEEEMLIRLMKIRKGLWT